MKTVPKSVRCAIYTRKSTDQGLDQDFNSLDASMMPRKPISAAKLTRAGRCYWPNTTTAASPAAIPTALPYSGSLRMCEQVRST